MKKPVFLVPENEPSANWDPITTGLSGFRLFSPIKNIPIVIRTSNALWLETVSNLLDRAGVILIDTSDISDSIQKELHMISSKGLSCKTIRLMEASPSHSEAFNSDEITIQYRRSWKGSVVKIFLSILLLIFLSFSFYHLLMRFVEPPTELKEWIKIGWGIFSVGLGVYFFRIFFKPGLNRNARKQIKETLARM